MIISVVSAIYHLLPWKKFTIGSLKNSLISKCALTFCQSNNQNGTVNGRPRIGCLDSLKIPLKSEHLNKGYRMWNEDKWFVLRNDIDIIEHYTNSS